MTKIQQIKQQKSMDYCCLLLPSNKVVLASQNIVVSKISNIMLFTIGFARIARRRWNLHGRYPRTRNAKPLRCGISKDLLKNLSC